MSLDKITLKAEIKAAFNDQKGKTENQEAAIDDLAQKITNAVENYVKSITVTSTFALTAPNGPVTGSITNTIS